MAVRSALLVMADGTWFQGEAFGFAGESVGEVVFNTSMSGYQEILTDPSYAGQIVTMTASHIGNYGTNPFDVESGRVQVAGFVVREASEIASNFRSTKTLGQYLADAQIVAATGIDTRALTLKIRTSGAMMGIVAHDVGASDVPALVEKISNATPYDAVDWVEQKSVNRPYRVVLRATGDRFQPWNVEFAEDLNGWSDEERALPLVAVIDFGIKFSILRNLVQTGVRAIIFPHNTPASTILAYGVDGVLLSNGPGDPGKMDATVSEVQALLGNTPLFGICLGHQLLGRAIGGQTFKLKFGHRGPNQPVMDIANQRVQITAQNHGYAVNLQSRESTFADVPALTTHINLNDHTVEGLSVPSLRAFGIQHHPEAGPGPNDALRVFQDFRAMLSTASR